MMSEEKEQIVFPRTVQNRLAFTPRLQMKERRDAVGHVTSKSEIYRISVQKSPRKLLLSTVKQPILPKPQSKRARTVKFQQKLLISWMPIRQ